MKLAPALFFKKYAFFAILNQINTGVPASITLAQSALESGWAGSGLTQNANNFFGIKANGNWKGATYSADTGEFYDNQYTIVQNELFRAYKSPYYSFKDHSNFLQENKRYSDLFLLSPSDFTGWANGLQLAGYATSPTYASKLINMVNQYELYKYDKQAVYIKVVGIVVIVGALAYLFKRYYLDVKPSQP